MRWHLKDFKAEEGRNKNMAYIYVYHSLYDFMKCYWRQKLSFFETSKYDFISNHFLLRCFLNDLQNIQASICSNCVELNTHLTEITWKKVT